MQSQFRTSRYYGILLSLLCLAIVYSPVSLAQSKVKFRIGGSGTDLGTMKLVAKELMQSHPEVSVEILPSLGSGGAVRAVAAGRLDIAYGRRGVPVAATDQDMADLISSVPGEWVRRHWPL